MSKTALAEIIKFHEKQIAENQRRIDELRGYFEPKPAMFGQALTQEDVKFFLFPDGGICGTTDKFKSCIDQGSYFISKEAAELESKKRRLRQLARVRMSESWGDERPDWEDCEQPKIGLYCSGQILGNGSLAPTLLHFRTREHAEAFLEEVGVDGIKLIWEL